MEFVLMARFVIKRLVWNGLRSMILRGSRPQRSINFDKPNKSPGRMGMANRKIREFIRIVVVRGHLILRDRLLRSCG